MITQHKPLLTRHPNRKLRKPKKHPERDLQEKCVYYVRKNHKNWLVFSVPNEFARGEAPEARRMGMLKGASDLIVVKPDQIFFIEFKSDIGTQTVEQKRFEAKVQKNGFNYYIIRDFNTFKNVVNGTCKSL